MILLYLSIGIPEAEACTCAGVTVPTQESCSRSKRAFTGTSAAQSFPLPIDTWGPTAFDSDLELSVTEVWRGDASRAYRSLQGFTPGSCGLNVAPGETFVVCDNRDGIDTPSLHACSGPVVGAYAEMLAHDLREGSQISHPKSLGQLSPRLFWRLCTVIVLLGTGFAALLLRRFRSKTELAARSEVLFALASASAIIASRFLGYQIWESFGLLAGRLVSGGVVLLSFACSGWYMGKSRIQAKTVLKLLAFGILYVACWNARPVFPIQPDGAVQCSIVHAKLLVDELEMTSTLKGGETAQLEDRSCMNWGLGRYRAVGRHSETCVEFDGIAGGTWQVCPEPYDVKHDLYNNATLF
jgi:hypothetical protein